MSGASNNSLETESAAQASSKRSRTDKEDSVVHLPLNGPLQLTLHQNLESNGTVEALLRCDALKQAFNVSANSKTPFFVHNTFLSFSPTIKDQFLSQLQLALTPGGSGSLWKCCLPIFSHFNKDGGAFPGFPAARYQCQLWSKAPLPHEQSHEHSFEVPSVFAVDAEGTYCPKIVSIPDAPLLGPCFQLMVRAIAKAMGPSFEMEFISLVLFNPHVAVTTRQPFHTDWERKPGNYPSKYHRVAVIMSCSDSFQLHFYPNFDQPTPAKPFSTQELLAKFGHHETQCCAFGGMMGFLDTTAHAGACRPDILPQPAGARLHVYGSFKGGQSGFPSKKGQTIDTWPIEYMN